MNTLISGNLHWQSKKIENLRKDTAWNVSIYGVVSGPYFPLFRLNTEIYFLYSVRIQENKDQKLLRIWTLFKQWEVYELKGSMQSIQNELGKKVDGGGKKTWRSWGEFEGYIWCFAQFGTTPPCVLYDFQINPDFVNHSLAEIHDKTFEM